MAKKYPLKKVAEVIRQQGQRGDSVLAHISPAEAQFLKHHFGGDKNPVTGLPQFGLFKKGKKLLKKAVKVVVPLTSKTFKQKILPFAAAMIGQSLGGPAGAQVGSAIGTAIGGGKKKDFLRNAALTYAGGKIFYGSGDGAGSMFGNGAGATGAGNTGTGGGLLGNLLGGGSGGGSGLLGQGLMGDVLAGTALYGLKKGKSEYKPYEGPSVQETMAQHGISKYPYVPVKRVKPPKNRQKKIDNPEAFDPQGYQQSYFEPMEEPEYYAQGGPVREGYIRGNTGAQTDNRHAYMPVGSYVMDGTTISLYGDGGSEAGAHRLEKLKDKFIKVAHAHGYASGGPAKMMPAMVSDEEMIWPPEAVYGAGIMVKGDPKKGPQVLDAFRKNLREHKGVKKFLPPKSKSAEYYLE